jgi:hypothetical protein
MRAIRKYLAAQAPADGRLAAAIATNCDTARRTRMRVARNMELNRRIGHFPFAARPAIARKAMEQRENGPG